MYSTTHNVQFYVKWTTGPARNDPEWPGPAQPRLAAGHAVYPGPCRGLPAQHNRCECVYVALQIKDQWFELITTLTTITVYTKDGDEAILTDYLTTINIIFNAVPPAWISLWKTRHLCVTLRLTGLNTIGALSIHWLLSLRYIEYAASGAYMRLYLVYYIEGATAAQINQL